MPIVPDVRTSNAPTKRIIMIRISDIGSPLPHRTAMAKRARCSEGQSAACYLSLVSFCRGRNALHIFEAPFVHKGLEVSRAEFRELKCTAAQASERHAR